MWYTKDGEWRSYSKLEKNLTTVLYKEIVKYLDICIVTAKIIQMTINIYWIELVCKMDMLQ